MKCFNGAEVYELVGANILHLLRTVMRKENVGLYRENGLGILQNASDPKKANNPKDKTNIPDL